MAVGKLKFDEDGKRFYETGVSEGVLYVMDEDGEYQDGVAWNGLTSVSENPSGADATPIWADDIKYLNLMANEEYGCTIEAYQSPKEFDICDGTAELIGASGISIGQQERRTFGFVYKTKIGNDVKADKYGYKIHIVYGCKAAPSGRDYQTINDSPEAMTLSWEVSTTPVKIESGDEVRYTATIVLDSTKVPEAKMTKIINALYGTDPTTGASATEGTAPTLLLPDEIIALYNQQ